MHGFHSLRRRWRQAIGRSFALAVLPVALYGHAYTVTVLMPVRMDVIGSCTISATNLDFGIYQSRGDNPAHGTATLNLTCPSEMTVEIALDGGTSSSRITRRRQLGTEGGRDSLNYDLYKDAGRTAHWGDKDDDTLVLRATGRPQEIPVYGEIAAGQRADAGSYNDVIIVTVSF